MKFKQHPKDLHDRVPNFPKQRFGELGVVELLKLRPVSVRVLNNSVPKIRQFCMPEPPHFPEEFFQCRRCGRVIRSEHLQTLLEMCVLLK